MGRSARPSLVGPRNSEFVVCIHVLLQFVFVCLHTKRQAFPSSAGHAISSARTTSNARASTFNQIQRLVRQKVHRGALPFDAPLQQACRVRISLQTQPEKTV